MEMVLNTRLIWNPGRMAEVEEAKQTYLKYRSEGYQIQKPDGTLVERFMNAGELLVLAKKLCGRVMTILSKEGDERLTWDKENGPEAKEAKAKFEELMGKNYMAFSVDSKGKKNRQIQEFDVDAEEILMIPPTSRG